MNYSLLMNKSNTLQDLLHERLDILDWNPAIWDLLGGLYDLLEISIAVLKDQILSCLTIFGP